MKKMLLVVGVVHLPWRASTWHAPKPRYFRFHLRRAIVTACVLACAPGKSSWLERTTYMTAPTTTMWAASRLASPLKSSIRVQPAPF